MSVRWTIHGHNERGEPASRAWRGEGAVAEAGAASAMRAR